MTRTIPHFVGGSLQTPETGRSSDVYDPDSGAVQARVPLASADEVGEVIANAEAAQPGFGDLHQHGPDAFRFYMKTKTVTSRWPAHGVRDGASFVIPTMH